MSDATVSTPSTRNFLQNIASAFDIPGAFDYLAARAIDDDVAEARGYDVAAKGSRGSAVPASYYQPGSANYSISIPLWALGADAPSTRQHRIGQPDALPESMIGKRFLIAKDTPRGDSRGHIPADVNPIASNVSAVNDLRRGLILCEGAPKADSAISADRRASKTGDKQRFGFVSFTGVAMPVRAGVEGGTDALHPKTIGSKNWAPLIRGRDVYLAFDGDLFTKRGVAEATRRSADALVAAGAKSVKVIPLPEGADGSKIGIDDYLAEREIAGDIDPLGALVKTAVRWSTVEKELLARKVIVARAKNAALGDVDLTSLANRLRDEFDGDIEDDDLDEALTWARDENGNSFLRAGSDEIARHIGGWRVYADDAVRLHIADNDRQESARLVAAIASRPDAERDELLGLDYDEIVSEIGLTPRVGTDVAVIDETTAPSFWDAVEAIREGSSKGASFSVSERREGGAALLISAEVSTDHTKHGIWVTKTWPDGPPSRNRVLPHVLVNVGATYRRHLLPDRSTELMEKGSSYSVAAVLPGGRVAVASGLSSAQSASPSLATQAIRSAGFSGLPEPVGADVIDATKMVLQNLAIGEQRNEHVFAQAGFVNLGGFGTRDFVHATPLGGVGADGLRPAVVAYPGLTRASVASYPQSAGTFGFPEIADAAVAADDFASAVREFVEIAPRDVTAPMIGAFLSGFFPRAYGVATLFVVGDRGSLKSALASRLLYACSGQTDGEAKTVSVARDTPKGAAAKAEFIADGVSLLDDYHPNAAASRKKSEEQTDSLVSIVSAAFERTPRAVLNNDGTPREGGKMTLSQQIVTAETDAGFEGSRSERLVRVRLSKGDIDEARLDAWKRDWIVSGRFRRALAAMVQGTALYLNRFGIPGDSRKDVGATYLLGKDRDGEGREAYNVAHIADGLAKAFVVLEELYGADSLHSDDAEWLRENLLNGKPAQELWHRLWAAQTEETASRDEGLIAIEAIREAIEGKSAVLYAIDGTAPAGALAYGWVTDARFDGDKVAYAIRPGADVAGVIAGDKVLLSVAFVNRTIRPQVGNMKIGDLRSKLLPLVSEEYRERVAASNPIYGFAEGGKVTRGYVFDAEALGLPPVEESARRSPKQHWEE